MTYRRDPDAAIGTEMVQTTRARTDLVQHGLREGRCGACGGKAGLKQAAPGADKLV